MWAATALFFVGGVVSSIKKLRDWWFSNRSKDGAIGRVGGNNTVLSNVFVTSGGVLNLNKPATATTKVLPREITIHSTYPHTRNLYARCDGSVFRECAENEADVVLTVAMFVTNATFLRALIHYSESDVPIHGCWMGQRYGYIKPEDGCTCELVLLSSKNGVYSRIDDRRSYHEPEATIFNRPATKVGFYTATVSIFWGDDGPISPFRYRINIPESGNASAEKLGTNQEAVAET